MHPGFHEIRRQQWIQTIQACENRPQGMTIVQWTREHNVSIKSYEYWKRKLRLEMLDQIKGSETASLPAMSKERSGLPCSNEPKVTFAEVPLTDSRQQNSTYVSSAFSPDAVVNVSGIAVGFANTASPELIDRILTAVTHVS